MQKLLTETRMPKRLLVITIVAVAVVLVGSTLFRHAFSVF